MTWRERTVLRILMFVAWHIAPTEWRDDIKHLANPIEVHTPKVEV